MKVRVIYVATFGRCWSLEYVRFDFCNLDAC